MGAYEYPAPTNTSGLFDYSGTAATDVAAFHSGTNQFFTLADGNLGQYGWGIPGDCYPLVWDYNQNGKTDISIYHIPTNQWFVKGYPGDNLGQYGFGLDDSVPVPGDYNGDGIIERAFYHWPTNRWFIDGQAGPDPVRLRRRGQCSFVGDYDGDGIADMMLYPPHATSGLCTESETSASSAGRAPTASRFPGTGTGTGGPKSPFITFPSNEWIWREKTGPHFMGRYGWGGAESFPIPGDYSGDGTTDRGFYRYAQNWWFRDGQTDFFYGWGGQEFMPITSQMAGCTTGSGLC